MNKSKIVGIIFIIFICCCKYKPILKELPSGKKIKELGFQEVYVLGKNERNFIYEYQTYLNLDNEEALKEEAKEIFCQLKKVLNFNRYNYIIIKSNFIFKRFLIFYIKGGETNTFDANKELCE